MTVRQDEIDACTRKNFYLYVSRAFNVLTGETLDDNWHIEAVCWVLQECYEGSRRRQIINLPPRHLKSLICSVFFPTWVLGHNPGAKFLCVSYGEDLAQNFSENAHRLMQTAFYRELFSTRISSHDRLRISTTARGYRRAISRSGALTGHGADYIILDDPTKADDAFSPSRLEATNRNFDQTISTRLNNPRTGKILVVMQRLAEDDLTGHLLSQGGWHHLAIPLVADHLETYEGYDRVIERLSGHVLHPTRMDDTEIARLRLNERRFQSQYQQNPQNCLTGSIFSAGWFQYFDAPPPSVYRIISVDIAGSLSLEADWSVFQIWDIVDGDFYLLHLIRVRLNFVALLDQARVLFEEFSPDIIFAERNGLGLAFCDEMRRRYGMRLQYLDVRASKIIRAAAVAPALCGEHVYLRNGAPYLRDFLNEIRAFPNGAHDDQVDAMVQVLDHAPALLRRIDHLGLSQRHLREPDYCNNHSQELLLRSRRRNVERRNPVRRSYRENV